MDSILNPDYRDMIECLQREGVEFMLVGGFAVMLYGWPRTTFDMPLERIREKRNG